MSAIFLFSIGFFDELVKDIKRWNLTSERLSAFQIFVEKLLLLFRQRLLLCKGHLARYRESFGDGAWVLGYPLSGCVMILDEQLLSGCLVRQSLKLVAFICAARVVDFDHLVLVGSDVVHVVMHVHKVLCMGVD